MKQACQEVPVPSRSSSRIFLWVLLNPRYRVVWYLAWIPLPGRPSGAREAGLFPVDSMPGKRVFLRVAPHFGLQLRGWFGPSSFCAGRAYGTLCASNWDPGSGLLWA